MAGRPFALAPFPGGPALPLRISGTASRQGARLILAYALTGDVARVAWPAPAASPSRRDQLWQQTCCECFIARPEKSGYWEVNLSPAGHWQLYRFDDYRQGGRPEMAVAALPVTTTRTAEGFELAAVLDLAPLLLAEQPLLLGVSMVVRTVDGTTSYWALAHPGERPDFHHRAAFCLTL